MESIGFALAKIFSERCAQHSGRPAGDLDTVCRELMEKGGLSREDAEALLWGESISVDLEQSKKLAEAFSIDPDLLGCLLRPTSREIILHVLRSFRADMDPACEDCAFLQASLEEAPKMSRRELMQTCLDFLEHLSPIKEEVSFAPGTTALIDVFSDLDDRAQARVLAYAYSEAANSLGDPMQMKSASYSRLRENLPPLQRQILDLLAEESKELSVQNIADRLHLADARSVGQLPRTLQRLLRGEGVESPLEVRRNAGQSFYKLSNDALELWQSLLRAEATLQR